MSLRGSIMALACCFLSSAAGASEDAPTRLLLPPVVSVYEAGMTGVVRHGQWSHVAAGHVATLWPEVLAGRVATPGTLSPAQESAIAEFQRLAFEVARRAKQQGGLASSGLEDIDARLGPSLAFLANDAAPTTVIGLVAIQNEQSAASAATQATLTASMLVQPWLVFLPAVTGVNLLVFEADARTGQVLWYATDRAIEVGGVNTGDLRNAESTRKLLGNLAARLPATQPRASAAGAPPAQARTPEAMPLEGHFRLLAPAGWSSHPGERSVSLTRDGEALNAIEVRLTPRGAALRNTAPATRSDSTPAEFAQWFVAELAASSLLDLQVLDSGPVGDLAGRPAFRVRYLHRSWVDGPLIETILVGASSTRGLLLASLTAPHLEYFARALPDFEKMLLTLERAPIRN